MGEKASRGFYRRYAQLMDSDVWPSETPVANELTAMAK